MELQNTPPNPLFGRVLCYDAPRRPSPRSSPEPLIKTNVKTLFLARHAKSSWNDSDLRDHERPLNGRGRKSAPKVGAYMQEQGWFPQIVLSSSSQRTRETWALLAEGLDGEPEVIFSDEMYLAGAGSLMGLIQSLPDTADAVMLLGHNPGMHSVADMLAGSGQDRHLEMLEYNFPTGALAVFEFDTRLWRECRAKSGTLIDFVIPREL